MLRTARVDQMTYMSGLKVRKCNNKAEITQTIPIETKTKYNKQNRYFTMEEQDQNEMTN